MRTSLAKYRDKAGFTLVEIVVVVSILGLFVCIVGLNLFGVLRRSSFRAAAQDLVWAMQTVASAAAANGRYYELIVDLPEQTYTLREITNADLAEVLPEQIIQSGPFGQHCRAVYVQFDDGQSTTKDRAKFRVGPKGWQYGGKIVLADQDDQLYTILVNRISRKVELVTGDVALPMPVQPELMRF